mgnify:FL=1
MEVIILCAGRGTRMAPLTDTVPKPMLSVLDKNLIEWKLHSLPEGVNHIILIVGYLEEKVRNYFGSSWNGIPITYLKQEELNGTGGAVLLAKDAVNKKALILMGDDIYEPSDLKKLSEYDFALLVFDEGGEGLKRKGQIIEENGLLVGINEGTFQSDKKSSLINTGACVISKNYFSYPPVKFSETEYRLPHTLVSISNDIPVKVLPASSWIQITTPECITKAEKILTTSK